MCIIQLNASEIFNNDKLRFLLESQIFYSHDFVILLFQQILHRSEFINIEKIMLANAVFLLNGK